MQDRILRNANKTRALFKPADSVHVEPRYQSETAGSGPPSTEKPTWRLSQDGLASPQDTKIHQVKAREPGFCNRTRRINRRADGEEEGIVQT